MALLSNYGFAYNTLIFHKPKAQLSRTVNYIHQSVNNEASIVNYNKKEGTLIHSKFQSARRLNHDKYGIIVNHKVLTLNYNKKERGLMKSLIHCMLDDVNITERKCSEYKSDIKVELQEAPVSIPKPPSKFQSHLRFIEGVLEMSRLENYVPALALVLVGGWIGAGRSFKALMTPGQVWIVSGCTALLTVASTLANDIFDFYSGTDQANGKTSPLLRGQVDPHHVGLVAGCLYGASVIGTCYLEPVSLRLLIGGAAVATYIYTPILKQLMMVKNVVIAGLISSSIFAGALAIGGKEQLQNPVIVAVALFFFLCILGRELLMDVGDMVGDKEAGVNTLAVHFGGLIGTLTASFCLAAANALLISLLAVKSQAFATIGTLSLLPLHAKILALCNTKETSIVRSIKQVVQQSIIHIGFSVLVLASAA